MPSVSTPVDRRTRTSRPRRPDPAAVPKVWLYGPWTDLLIGCGAWSAPLLLATYSLSLSHAASWSFAFYALALLLNYPHFMATIYRAYHSYDEFSRYRLFTVHTAILLAATGVVAHLWYPLLPWIFTLYICWSPWHYTGQNFGLMMMFARRAGIAPTEQERNALHLSFVASFVMLMLSFNTGVSNDPFVLSLNLPAAWTAPTRALLAAAFVCAGVWSLWSMSRRASWRSLLPVATLVSTQFFWFLLPAVIELITSKDVPQTRYSSGILAVLHSAQYLWVTSFYQQKEAAAHRELSWNRARYWLILVAGGIALFVPGPWIVSRALHVDFAASFLTFTALVSLHHFILDGAIWKLRDSKVAAFLLNKPPASEDVATQASTWRSLAAWFAGPSVAARTLRVSVLLALLLWGGLDRLRYYWAHVDSSSAAVERAIRLNPQDSSAQMRLAQSVQASGDRQGALIAMQRAVQLSPRNRVLQEAYERGLIEAGRTEDAFQFYRQTLAADPNNAAGWLNFGVLAVQRGDSESAVQAWQQALRVDPLQPTAHLYLAAAFEQKGEPAAAATHYRAYLQAVSLHPDDHAQETRTVISALIKVADANYASGKVQEARTGYQKAQEFALRISNRQLQSLALVHLADLDEHSRAPRQAADAYQRALRLDQQLPDTPASASDWFDYGQFLRRQNQPEALAYACFLRAGSLLKSTPGAEQTAVSQALQESAARLGKDTSVVQSQLPEWIEKALQIPASSFPEIAQ